MNKSDDTISRQVAIDALRYAQHRFTVADEAGGMGTVKWSEDVIYFAAAENVLTNLPSAQRWIPVSERLPKPDEEVFVYLWGNVPHLASVNSEGQWETDQFYLDADDTPKAWMPLPEPYKEGQDDRT